MNRSGFRSRARHCAATRCCRVIPIGRVFCPDHWFMLTEQRRLKIKAAFRHHDEAAIRKRVNSAIALIETQERPFTGLFEPREVAK